MMPIVRIGIAPSSTNVIKGGHENDTTTTSSSSSSQSCRIKRAKDDEKVAVAASATTNMTTKTTTMTPADNERETSAAAAAAVVMSAQIELKAPDGGGGGAVAAHVEQPEPKLVSLPTTTTATARVTQQEAAAAPESNARSSSRSTCSTAIDQLQKQHQSHEYTATVAAVTPTKAAPPSNRLEISSSGNGELGQVDLQAPAHFSSAMTSNLNINSKKNNNETNIEECSFTNNNNNNNNQTENQQGCTGSRAIVINEKLDHSKAEPESFASAKCATVSTQSIDFHSSTTNNSKDNEKQQATSISKILQNGTNHLTTNSAASSDYCFFNMQRKSSHDISSSSSSTAPFFNFSTSYMFNPHNHNHPPQLTNLHHSSNFQMSQARQLEQERWNNKRKSSQGECSYASTTPSSRRTSYAHTEVEFNQHPYHHHYQHNHHHGQEKEGGYEEENRELMEMGTNETLLILRDLIRRRDELKKMDKQLSVIISRYLLQIQERLAKDNSPTTTTSNLYAAESPYDTYYDQQQQQQQHKHQTQQDLDIQIQNQLNSYIQQQQQQHYNQEQQQQRQQLNGAMETNHDGKHLQNTENYISRLHQHQTYNAAGTQSTTNDGIIDLSTASTTSSISSSLIYSTSTSTASTSNNNNHNNNQIDSNALSHAFASSLANHINHQQPPNSNHLTTTNSLVAAAATAPAAVTGCGFQHPPLNSSLLVSQHSESAPRAAAPAATAPYITTHTSAIYGAAAAQHLSSTPNGSGQYQQQHGQMAMNLSSSSAAPLAAAASGVMSSSSSADGNSRQQRSASSSSSSSSSHAMFLSAAAAAAAMAASNRIAYRCHVCGSGFEDRHRLQQHLSIHLNLHPSWYEERTIKKTMDNYEAKRGDYLCGKCEIRFETTAEFDKHMRSHGEKPHQCDLCEQDNKLVTFRYYRQLLTHLRSHCFLYTCKFNAECKQTSNRKDYLKLHILKHHLNNKLPEQYTICCH